MILMESKVLIACAFGSCGVTDLAGDYATNRHMQALSTEESGEFELSSLKKRTKGAVGYLWS